MKLIEIRQVIADHTKKLDPTGTFKRNAYPGSFGGGYVKKNTMGQYLHGLTEDELKSYGESLGVNLKSNEDGMKNPNAELSYWATKFIPLYEKDKDYVTLDQEVLEDVLTLKAGIESGYYAPSADEVGLGKYLYTNFYVHDPNIEITKKQGINQKKNEIGAKLETIAKSEDRLKYVCFYLEVPLFPTSNAEYMYNKLDELKNITTNIDQLNRISKVMSMNPMDLQTNYMVKKGKLYKMLQWDSNENEYVFNNQKFGVDDENCIKSFSEPSNANNLQLLINEVNKKEKNK
jgi:hypothetical protein